jgi:hypothetical protein
MIVAYLIPIYTLHNFTDNIKKYCYRISYKLQIELD